MKILICGDVVGRKGREILIEYIPKIKKNELIDFVIVNGENAANGFGITPEICNQFYSLGVDVITTGNHVWDQKKILSHIEKDPRLIRPINFPKNSPGKGFGIFEMPNGLSIVVINVLCRLFMDLVDDPFKELDLIIEKIKNKKKKIIIIVDVHGEATSEKMAIAHYLDGRVTAVVGTHTHVPTADQHILENGTFYQTDLGMCGDYNTVVGMNKHLSILRFMTKHNRPRLEPGLGKATLCGAIIDISEKSYLVLKYKQLKIDGLIGV